MYSGKIPESTVARLSAYLRELTRLEEEKQEYSSSFELSHYLGFTDAQIRRDLNYFGQFGRTGRGYHVAQLKAALGKILGIEDRVWLAALVGIGNLGSALLLYRGFRHQGFHITAIFDVDKQKINRKFRGIKVEDAQKISEVVKEKGIKIGIITVPADAGQEAADRLIDGGVEAVLNFAPVRIVVPEGVRLRNVDLSMELENLSFYLSREEVK